MTWSTFYLIFFVVGFVFSVLSVFGGGGRLRGHGHIRLPRLAGHPVGGLSRSRMAPRMGRGPARGAGVSFFNGSSAMAFLAWFGGTGYLLTRYSSLWISAILILAVLSGLLASALVFVFLVKVLLANENELDPADFDPIGVLGKVNVTIRAEGTGEVLFSQAGTRRATGARSDDRQPIAKGTAVVITRYERGIAYVRPSAGWTDDSGEAPAAAIRGEATPQSE